MKIKMIFFTILIFTSFVFAQERQSAVVLKARGDAKVFPKGKNDAQKLKKGKMLNSGDKIVTGKRSFVAIKFLDDATLLRGRSNSECVVRGEWNDEGEQEKSIWLTLCNIWASITRQKTSFEVVTPTAVASVKGTQFWSIQFEDGSTMFIGEGGMVEVSNDKGTVLMRKGQTAEVKGKDNAPTVRRTKPGDTPALDDDEMMNRFQLEIEFDNDQQEKKTLIIDVDKQ